MPAAVVGRLDLTTVSAGESDKIDQALFGYSEGHRQIATSVRLPAADLYRLSAASDLATGTKLALDESYITGLPLEESKRYALLRTWPAPELARPGCVWSHVLLLDARALSTRANLHDFVQCFRRPHGDFSAYSAPTPVDAIRNDAGAIDEPELQRAIENYYLGRPALLSAALDPKTAEGIVTAIWSQQWPRLRASFTFRTARTERRKSELVQYDVQVRSPGEVERVDTTPSKWVIAGARDAGTGRVTDLRRFLWRYGRDIPAARSWYRMLVELYLLGRDHQNIPTERALRVFRLLPEPSDGETLKKDILGFPAASPSLSPPISLTGLLDVLADQKMHRLVPPGIIAQRFRDLGREDVGPVARHLSEKFDALSLWTEDIENAVVMTVDAPTLSRDFPQRFLMPVLRARPDLVGEETVNLLSNDQLTELFDVYSSGAAADALASEAVRRDIGLPKRDELIKHHPDRLFDAALNAITHGDLSPVWRGVWPQYASAIFANGWPRKEHLLSRIALGVANLGYPRRVGPSAEEWRAVLASVNDDLHDGDRVILLGYLLRAALDESSSGTWKLCAKVYPELRPVILRGALPHDTYRMLSSDLPTFNTAGYWDINRRVLICLSYLRRTVSDVEAEGGLSLSDHDLRVLYDGAADEDKSKRSRFWWF